MIRNYIKIALRGIWKDKGYSLLNIGGLAIGMAASILILLWVQNEMSYDMFHSKKDRLYLAGNRAIWNDEVNVWFSTPKPFAKAVKDDFPEVENVSRLSNNAFFLLSVEDKKITQAGSFVDSAFLEMFDFQLLAGDKEHVLRSPTEIVLTEITAKRLFGDENALGKIVKVDSTDYLKVSGVLADLPGNTRFNFDYLLPWSYMEKLGWSDENWHNNSVYTYLELTPTATEVAMNSKLKDMVKRYTSSENDTEMLLHALPNWWLYSKFENGKIAGGRIEMVRLFTIIACFILLIACINFMNLSTARSEKRSKEVGVRKVAGAYRHSLISQFLSESILISFLAGIFALIIVWLALPYFNDLVSRRLFLDLKDSNFWLASLGFILATGLLAGSYPAFFLSSFKPVTVLKGTYQKINSAFNSRKILVVLQFTIAIVLIVSTLVINKQILHGKDRESGYEKKNLIYVYEDGDIPKNFSLIKDALIKERVAESITRTSSPFTESWSNSGGFQWRGKSPDNTTIFDRFCADDNIVKNAGLTLLEGRDFDLKKYPTDSTAVILNESAVKAMGFDDPIGREIEDSGITWHVVGIVQDFIMKSPFEPISPLVIEGAKGFFGIIHIKFNPSLSTSDALAKTHDIFEKYNPDYPLEYKFVDEAYAVKFEESQQIGNLATLFAFLTILISCLGLFGLAAFTAENRTKEIGVRKVLGASVFSIARLLSKDFIGLVLISCLVAFPIAYWTMHAFLQSFAYRISLGWQMFAVAGIGAVLIALITVSGQALKAAIANPVDSLRDE